MSDAINAGSLELQLEVDSSKLLADLSAVADKAGKQIERTLQKQIDRLDASRVEATFTNLSNQINRQFSELSRVQSSTLNQLNRSAGNSQGLKLMRREASDLSSSLRELRDAHRQLRDQFRVSTSIKIDTSDLRRTIREIKELRANVSDPFKISTSSEQSRVISQARSRNQVVRVREDSTLFGGIKTGFVEGIGQNIADRFSSGLLDSVESTLGISLKSIGSRIGNRGARVPKIATDHFLKGVGIAGGSEILTKEFNRVLSSWESLTDKSAARIGHSLAKGISGELSEVQKSLAGLFKDITSTGLETVASPLRIRKHILSSNATQEVLKRQSKIAVDQNEAVRQAKSITLVSGGMDFQPGGRANTNFIKEILKPVLPDSYLVPISNPATNDPKGFASEFDQFAQNLLKSVGQEVKGTDFRGVGKLIEMGILKGLNPDAIKMAATAYAYKQAYPDKPINFVGASAGGYASADAAYILSLLGVESKSLGIATPFTGALTLNDPKNLKAPIGLADPIYHKLFSTFPVNPGSFQETYPGIGLKHLIPKFLAEAPVQSTIQDFLGDRIGNISPDVTGKAGYRNMLGFISAKASEAETVKGAINRSLGNPGEESLFYDPKGSRFSQTFLKLHINKLKEVSQKATGKVAQEAAEYIEFLEDFYKQLEQHYASNQEHLPDLPQVSKFFPGIRIPSQPQQPETSSSPRSVKLTADQMGSLLPPNVRSDLERVISTPNRSNSLALGSLSQGKLPRPQEMLDAFETDIVRRVSNVRRSILEIKKNVNSNTPEGMRAAVEVVSGVAQARTALDSLMSELGDSATKPIKKAVKEARRQLTVSENKAKPIAESQTARSLGLDYGGGLSEGLVGSISEVQQAAMRLAEVGTETIREAWDIHSPSKVGIYLGRMLGLGVRLGLISEVEKDEIANSAESVLDKLKQSFNPGQLFGGVGDRFKGLADGVKGLVGAFAGFAILNQVGKLLDQFQAQAREAAVEAERIERVIIFSSSSKTEGIKNLNFAKDEAKRLSLDLRSSLEGFADFTSSTKGTSLEGEQTNKIFSGVAQFSSVIGLDPQRQELVFKALSQMAGKGVVSMEELRQQLGDSLPGALAIAARSMNMTQQEFINLVKSGNLLAEDFLPKFAAQMSSESSTGLAGSAKSAQSSINRFNNSVYELQVGLGKTLLPLQNMSFDVLGAGLEFVAKHIKEINVLLQTIVGYSALSLLQTLGVAPKTWAAAWLSFKGVLSGVSGALSGVSSAILTLNFSNLIQGIGASVTALSAMLNKFLLVGIAIAGASAALEFFSDKGGKAREASDSVSRSLEKLQKSQSEKPSSNKTWLGKGIDQLSDKAKKGIFGDNDDPNWLKEFIFGSPVSKNNGDPSKEVNQAKEQQDTLKALREFQSGGSRVLGRVASDLNSPLIGAISSLDDQINNQRIKIGSIRLTNPQDTKGLKDAEAQLDELIKRREKLAEIPIANKAALEDFIAQSESLIKDLGDNPAYRDFIEKTLKPQLEMAYKWRDAFNQSIDSASSRLQKFEKAWQRVNDQAEDTSQSIKDLLNTQMASLSDRFASGGVTKGQYESQQQSLQTESLRREIANSEQRIQTLRNELASMNAPSILAQNKLSNAGAAELKTAAEKASDPQTKSVISKSAELKTVESQVTESRKQLAQELAQTAQTFRDFTKSANEFFRGIQKETELLQYDLQSLDLDGKILQVKTKILGALRGTYSTFVDDFAESIIGIFETITEGSKSIINANKENKQRIQAAQDKAKEGTDLKNSAPGEGGTGGGPSVDTKGYTVYSTGGGTSPITNYSQSRPHHTYQKNSLGQDVRDYTFEKGGSVRVDVPSISSGVVTHAGPKGGYGNAVLVKDDTTGEETLVGHLETVHVKTGQRVSFGQSIGIQGSTGQSQAEHVHLEASPELMKRYIDSVLKGSFPNVGGGSSGSPRPAGGGAGAGSFSNTFGFNSNRAKQAYQFYVNQGFSPQAASYIVGNYMQESSLEEWRKNGEHHGLGQWSSARRSAQGGLPSSFEGQLQFSLKDLQSDSPGSLKVFKNPNASEAEVAKAIERWMRYGSDESGSRFQYGKQLFQQVKGSSSGAGGQSPSTEQSNSQIDSATQQGLDNVRQINDRVSRNAQLSQQYGLAKAGQRSQQSKVQR